ncbi:hypothetical protein Tco_0021022 [Tanacetum coccineum]
MQSLCGLLSRIDFVAMLNLRRSVSNKDANQNFLRALPSSWNNVALIMRNKDGIEDLDINDLYNNLKVFESDIKDYSLWQVILNGDGPIQVTTDEKDVETEDAKSLWDAIKSRFGGNVESKKMQKNVLKQQFENFSVYVRFQKLISLLEVHGAAVPNEDANQKFLIALPSSWNNVALIMRNKDGIDDLDINDLYNNLKVFEADIKGSFGSSSKSQNVAFLSTEDTSSSNEVNTANGVILQGNVEHQEIKETRIKMQGIGARTTPEGLYQ